MDVWIDGEAEDGAAPWALGDPDEDEWLEQWDTDDDLTDTWLDEQLEALDSAGDAPTRPPPPICPPRTSRAMGATAGAPGATPPPERPCPALAT